MQPLGHVQDVPATVPPPPNASHLLIPMHPQQLPSIYLALVCPRTHTHSSSLHIHTQKRACARECRAYWQTRPLPVRTPLLLPVLHHNTTGQAQL
jgi:hypothetical protein